MKRILLVAKNAFRAVMSQRAVYMWGFAILIIFLISGRAIFTRETRPEVLAFIRTTSVSAAVAVWGYMCVAAAIYLGATLLVSDLRTKTIITVLARPVRRWELLLGKWIGLSVFCLVTLAIGIVLAYGLATYLQLSVDGDALAAGVLGTVGAIVLFGGIATALSTGGSAPIAGAVAVLVMFLPMLIAPLREDPDMMYQRIGALLDAAAPPGYESEYGGAVWAPPPVSQNVRGRLPSQLPQRPTANYSQQRARMGESVAYAAVYFIVGCAFFARRDLTFS